MNTLIVLAGALYVGYTVGSLQNLNRRLKRLLDEIDKIRR